MNSSVLNTMNSFKHLFLLVALALGAISCSRADASTNAIPVELRLGSFSCSGSAVQTAIDLKHAGWTYIMPEPKSRQAAWGNPDGRTTWWVGYWVNGRTGASSFAEPKKRIPLANGLATATVSRFGGEEVLLRHPAKSNGSVRPTAAFRHAETTASTILCALAISELCAPPRTLGSC